MHLCFAALLFLFTNIIHLKRLFFFFLVDVFLYEYSVMAAWLLSFREEVRMTAGNEVAGKKKWVPVHKNNYYCFVRAKDRRIKSFCSHLQYLLPKSFVRWRVHKSHWFKETKDQASLLTKTINKMKILSSDQKHGTIT